MGSNNNIINNNIFNNNINNMVNNNLELEVGQIADFFVGTTILVTGGTGFVGKVLVEKLLRSCPGIKNIYLLMRPKRGHDVLTRFKELLKNPVFDRLKAEGSGSALDKMAAICGDVSEPGLGLSPDDRQMLCDDVNIVFHSAATVRFNEVLKTAVMMNTAGTMSVVQLCREMTSLRSLVHVSTAYSNPDRRKVEELVYRPPLHPDSMVQCCQTLPESLLDAMERQVLSGKHPNTYTVTKAMAEWVVREATDLPAAIVRPSIVTAAQEEPVPGWVDNVSGITGIMMEIGRGTIRSIICEDRLIVDLIPVDTVVNTLIAVAYNTATTNQRGDIVTVYNCTSGQLNPIRWHQLGELTHKHACASPSRHVTWYPGFKFRTNRFAHKMAEIFLHFLPAFLLDIVMRAQHMKPIMVKIAHRFKKAAKTGEFFSLHEFDFSNQNLLSLPRDKDFPCDVRKMSWDEYVNTYVRGIRAYVLKDPNSSLAGAKKKLKVLFWVHRVTQVLALALLASYVRPLISSVAAILPS